MNRAERNQLLKEWIFKRSAYTMALAIIDIDKQTVAPSGGNAYRDERAAFLAGELFSIETDESMLPVLEEMQKDEEEEPYLRRAAYLYQKEMYKTVCIPKDEFVALEELKSVSYTKWLEAKKNNDYTIFEPYLKKIIEAKKKVYAYRNDTRDLYDQMLDDFEPGMNQEKYDAFFDALKEKLVPLIQKVTEAKQINDQFLFETYPVEEQKKFMDHLLEYLHFDPQWGYQNETEHPFTSWTCENDCRTTTKYLEDNVMSAIFSTVHEVGHAYYEHDCDPRFDGMILSDGISSGMHESQSRLCENYLGRRTSFWEYNYPYLQKQFPQQLKDISLDTFMKAVNVSRPSLVRTEADELTYPMHILVRYEIEKGLFNGSISVEGLDKTWSDMYEKYLGVRPMNASEGILQDVHWSCGEFGYFPTYALGSAFAAQFVKKMQEEIDVDDLLSNNHYDTVIEWLKNNIHQYGCMYDADEIMQKATGTSFDVNVYIEYLTRKYTELYDL